MPTFPGSIEDLRRQFPNVEIIDTTPKKAEEEMPKTKAEKLMKPQIIRAIGGGKVTIFVAVETKSETNERSWKGRSRRSGAAWKAVREAVSVHLGLLEPFALHYAAHGALRVTFTRTGGRKMDKSNLPAAMKGCEDATAFLLGADDGDSRWHAEFGQEPFGDVGVRIEVEIFRD